MPTFWIQPGRPADPAGDEVERGPDLDARPGTPSSSRCSASQSSPLGWPSATSRRSGRASRTSAISAPAPLAGERAGGRAGGPGDDQPRVARLEPAGRLVGDPLGPAEQEDPPAQPGGVLAEVVDQVRAGHPLGERGRPPPRGPDQRRAVGQQERGPVVDGPRARAARRVSIA